MQEVGINQIFMFRRRGELGFQYLLFPPILTYTPQEIAKLGESVLNDNELWELSMEREPQAACS